MCCMFVCIYHNDHWSSCSIPEKNTDLPELLDHCPDLLTTAGGHGVDDSGIVSGLSARTSCGTYKLRLVQLAPKCCILISMRLYKLYLIFRGLYPRLGHPLTQCMLLTCVSSGEKMVNRVKSRMSQTNFIANSLVFPNKSIHVLIHLPLGICFLSLINIHKEQIDRESRFAGWQLNGGTPREEMIFPFYLSLRIQNQLL